MRLRKGGYVDAETFEITETQIPASQRWSAAGFFGFALTFGLILYVVIWH